MNVHKLVLYDVNADVTLVLYDTKLLLTNVHNDVLYKGNGVHSWFFGGY